MMKKQIAVLGAGSWGSVLANVLAENGHQVQLWSRNPDQVAELNEHHTNQKYLADFTYQPALHATTDMAAAVTGAQVVLVVIPTKGLRQVSHQLAQVLAASGDQPVIAHATKGLEQATYKRPSEILAEEIPAAHRQAIVVLSGPSHAESVAIHDMTAVTAASEDLASAELLQSLFSNQYFRVYTNDDVIGVDMRPYVLEGGSIDTDGCGTLLTTTECLCSVNRNEYLTREEIEQELKSAFGLDRILWLDHGSLTGDDTDSHVDILARFCSPDTIAYMQCTDPRLPASYANFLILNGAVLLPGAASDKDRIAKARLQEAFPDREIIVIDCRPLLSGHGSLHCVTMQFPEGYLRTENE